MDKKTEVGNGGKKRKRKALPPPDGYLNADDLSGYLRRSPGAIRNLVLRRAIPFRKPAGRLLFIKKEIDSWVGSSEGVSLEEVRQTQ